MTKVAGDGRKPGARPQAEGTFSERSRTADTDERLCCPKCACPHVPVWYTRHRAKAIHRVRICRYCGHRFVTRER